MTEFESDRSWLSKKAPDEHRVRKVQPGRHTARLKCRYLADMGELSDRFRQDQWGLTEEASFNYDAGTGDPRGPRTYARFCWDDSHLRFYMEVEDDDSIGSVNRNDVVWLGNNIEIILSPHWPAEPKLDEYEFLFNSTHGHACLYWSGPSLEEALRWECRGLEWRLRSPLAFHPEAAGWSLEGRVPFVEFGVARPQLGHYWGLGLFRRHQLDGAPLLLAWSPPLTDPVRFHTPSRFGMLTFTE